MNLHKPAVNLHKPPSTCSET